MSQADRDRLLALKKAKDKRITQGQAAEELGISERQSFLPHRVILLGRGDNPYRTLLLVWLRCDKELR